MVKRAHAPTMRAVKPSGPISDFATPVPVKVLVNYDPPFHSTKDLVVEGWAIAYTRSEGLVVMRSGEQVTWAWLPAAHIRRR